MAEDEELVATGPLDPQVVHRQAALLKQRIDQTLIVVVQHRPTRVQLALHVLHLAGEVVLGHDVEALGLQPKGDVLAHQHHLAVLVLTLKGQRRIDDLMVVLAVLEHLGGVHTVEVVLGHHLELALAGAVQRYPIRQQVALGDAVEVPDELPRLVVDGVVAFFEGVKFFKDLDGDGDAMLLEAFDGRVVVKDHRGVQHEDLPVFLLHPIKERC